MKSFYDLSSTTQVSQWKKLDSQKTPIISRNQSSIHCHECESHTHTHHVNGSFPVKTSLASFPIYSQSPLIPILSMLTGRANTPYPL